VVIVKKPAHPVAELATFELRDYRGKIEKALTVAPEGSTDAEVLRKRLAEVTAEEESRVALRKVSAWDELKGGWYS
jgi:hypothetical protein